MGLENEVNQAGIEIPPEISDEISAMIRVVLAEPGDPKPTVENAADLSRDSIIDGLTRKAYLDIRQWQDPAGIATRIAIANALSPDGDGAEGLEQLSSAKFMNLLHLAKKTGDAPLIEKLESIIGNHNETVTSHLKYLLRSALEAEDTGDKLTTEENLELARQIIGASSFNHNSDLAAIILNLPAKQLNIFMEFLAARDYGSNMIIIALALLERPGASVAARTEAYRKISRYYKLKRSYRKLVELNKEFLAFLSQQTPSDKADKDQLTETKINNYKYTAQGLITKHREHDPNYHAMTQEEEFAFLEGILKGSLHFHFRREALTRIVALCQNLEQDEIGERYAEALLQDLRTRPEPGRSYENRPETKKATAALLHFKRKLGRLRPSSR